MTQDQLRKLCSQIYSLLENELETAADRQDESDALVDVYYYGGVYDGVNIALRVLRKALEKHDC